MSPFFAFWTLLIQAICLGRSSSESGDQSTHAVRGSPTTLCEGLQTPHSRMTEGLTARQEPTPFGRPEVGDVRRGQETCAERDLCRAPSARWCATRTGYDALDARIAKTLAKREELLTVLSEPTVPLHNNASELGARVSARRRDVSLHSRSERGARWTFSRHWYKPRRSSARVPTPTFATGSAAPTTFLPSPKPPLAVERIPQPSP
jgi:hypothetical protein